MGYYSSLTGELTISPPLTWAEFRTSEFFKGSPAWRIGYACIRLDEDREPVETDEGKAEVITCERVVPSSDDSMKVYELKDEVQRLVDAFPGHKFGGEFLICGEESGDVWKLVVDEHRKATAVHPRIVWPDGTELRGRHNN